ncbi:hypothetical protein EON63_07285 [archaeon]|nr:MAG: hypothetical protein EON63_07285 [archaeon]
MEAECKIHPRCHSHVSIHLCIYIHMQAIKDEDLTLHLYNPRSEEERELVHQLRVSCILNISLAYLNLQQYQGMYGVCGGMVYSVWCIVYGCVWLIVLGAWCMLWYTYVIWCRRNAWCMVH